MKRIITSKEDLVNWMTAELKKIEGCEACSIGDVSLLKQPDKDGCNWSDSFVVRTGGVPKEYFSPYLDKIVANARAKFNVE